MLWWLQVQSTGRFQNILGPGLRVALGAAPQAQLFGGSSASTPHAGCTRPFPKMAGKHPRPVGGKALLRVLVPPPLSLGGVCAEPRPPALPPGQTVSKWAVGGACPCPWPLKDGSRVSAEGYKCWKDPRTSSGA